LSESSQLILTTLFKLFSGRAHATANFLRLAFSVGKEGYIRCQRPMIGMQVRRMR
jgi:hypothetical protein